MSKSKGLDSLSVQNPEGKGKKGRRRSSCFRLEDMSTFTVNSVHTDGRQPSPRDEEREVLPAHVVQAMETFKKSGEVFRRPDAIYKTFEPRGYEDESYNFEDEKQLDNTNVPGSPLNETTKPRPYILQAYAPVYKWNGGVEVALCHRYPAKALVDDERRTFCRILIRFESLNFKVGDLEPLYCEFALYDLMRNRKISESFYWNPNNKKLNKSIWKTDEYNTFKKDCVNNCKDAIFVLPADSYNIYLVCKIYKVLEGDPKSFTDNYIKCTSKAQSAIIETAADICSRLREFRQILAWSASPCFDDARKCRDSSISSDFKTLYRTPNISDAFNDEAVFKALNALDEKNKKLTKIPGSLRSKCSRLPKIRADGLRQITNSVVLDPSLQIVEAPPLAEEKSSSENSQSHSSSKRTHKRRLVESKSLDLHELSTKDRIVREVLHLSHTGSKYSRVNSEYSNSLFIYPQSVKILDYRNVSIKVEICSDYTYIPNVGNPSSMKCIHSRNDPSHLVSATHTAVTHHERVATFGDEIKIELPRNLRPHHHVLFTFLNVKCKKEKNAHANADYSQEVGYSVLPLYLDGRAPDSVYTLPVIKNLNQNYMIQCVDFGKDKILAPSKSMFRVQCRLESSLYTNDPYLAKFFRECKFKALNDMEVKEDNGLNETFITFARVGQLRQQALKIVTTLKDRWVVLSKGAKNNAELVLAKSHSDTSDTTKFEILDSTRVEILSRTTDKDPYLFSITKAEDPTEMHKSTRDLFKESEEKRPPAQHGKEWLDSNQLVLAAEDKDEMDAWVLAIAHMQIRSWDKPQSITGIKYASSTLVKKFLPIIMRMLFAVMCTKSKDLERVFSHEKVQRCRVAAFQAMLHVCATISSDASLRDRSQVLDSYVACVFDDYHCEYDISGNPITAYRAICTLWLAQLNDKREQDPQNYAVLYSWFLFDIMIKSMILYVKRTSKGADPGSFRDEGVKEKLKTLVNALTKKIQTLPEKYSRLINQNLALFMRDLLYVLDREFMFDMIALYLGRISMSKEKLSSANKFVFLELIFDHDSFVPLCKGSKLKEGSDAREYFDQYNHETEGLDSYIPPREMKGTRQFFPQLLLCEILRSYHHTEASFVLERAAYTFRKVLTKHEYDTRYQDDERRARIAAMYLDYLPDMWQKLEQLNRIATPDAKRDILACFLYIIRNVPHKKLFDFLKKHKTRVIEHHYKLEARDKMEEKLDIKESEEAKKEEQSIIFDEQDITAGWFCQFINILAEMMRFYEYPNRRVTPGEKECKNVNPDDINSTILVPRLVSKLLSQSSSSPTAGRSPTLKPSQSLLIPDSSPLPGSKSRKSLIGSMKSGSPKNRDKTLPRSATITIPEDKGSEVKLPAKDPREIIKHVRKWERVLSTEVAIVLLDTTKYVIEPFFDGFLKDEEEVQKKFIELMLNFLNCNLSDSVLVKLFEIQSVFLKKYSARIFAHRRPLIDANGCKNWWHHLLRHGCFQNVIARDACIEFMYQLLKACYDQVGSLTRILRPLSEAFQVVFDAYKKTPQTFIAFRQMLENVQNHAKSDPHKDKPHILAFSDQIVKTFNRMENILKYYQKLKEDKNMSDEDVADARIEMYKLYTHSPRMMIEMLEELIKLHSKTNWVEAGLCHLEIAKILRTERKRPDAFGLPADSQKMVDSHLKQAAELFVIANMPEQSVTIFMELTEFYKSEMIFEQIESCMQRVVALYKNIGEFARGNDVRIFGSYYRVGFYGREFGELHLREYVYKEPMITQLNEIKDRLLDYWSRRLGDTAKVTVYGDSRTVDHCTILKGQPKIQITSVDPFSFEDDSHKADMNYIPQREYDLHTNLENFVFETPFTKGGKTHGTTDTQYKRRVLLWTEEPLPCKRKRLRVVKRSEIVLTPIECACDEMRKRIRIIHSEINPKNGVVSLKTLSQVLSGSVVPQVHSGSTAIVNIFLAADNVANYDAAFVSDLRKLMQHFLRICHQAIHVHRTNCKDEREKMFQAELDKGFTKLIRQVGTEVFPDGIPKMLTKLKLRKML